MEREADILAKVADAAQLGYNPTDVLAAVGQLRPLLGTSVSYAQCVKLLISADMDVSRAVNHHFAAGTGGPLRASKSQQHIVFAKNRNPRAVRDRIKQKQKKKQKKKQQQHKKASGLPKRGESPMQSPAQRQARMLEQEAEARRLAERQALMKSDSWVSMPPSRTDEFDGEGADSDAGSTTAGPEGTYAEPPPARLSAYHNIDPVALESMEAHARLGGGGDGGRSGAQRLITKSSSAGGSAALLEMEAHVNLDSGHDGPAPGQGGGEDSGADASDEETQPGSLRRPRKRHSRTMSGAMPAKMRKQLFNATLRARNMGTLRRQALQEAPEPGTSAPKQQQPPPRGGKASDGKSTYEKEVDRLVQQKREKRAKLERLKREREERQRRKLENANKSSTLKRDATLKRAEPPKVVRAKSVPEPQASAAPAAAAAAQESNDPLAELRPVVQFFMLRALAADNLAQIELCLDSGVDVNQPIGYLKQPLALWALRMRKFDIYFELVKRGAIIPTEVLLAMVE